tara:strand:+ start:47 stop:1045 length:999 start_codon:yes stop_codon:yes gene_type:complete
MKTIFVSGADGFIGSHLVEKLVSCNFKVKALCYYNSQNSYGWLDNIKNKNSSNLDVEHGDIRNISSFNKLVSESEIVLHLAALIAIPYSYNTPDSYIDTNIKGTYNILESSKINKIKKIIVTSTSEVYGTAKKIPITEDHILQPQSPYSASKISADNLSMAYYYSYNLPISIIRPFNTFGPRQSARAVIPTIISQIASGRKLLKLGSVDTKRNFNYVDDITSAYLKMISIKNISGQTFNIGNEYNISIKNLVSMISNHMNVKIKIEKDNKRLRPKKSEVNILSCSSKKAQKLLKWKPQYNNEKGLKRGLAKTIDWFQNKDNLKFYKTDIYNI